MNKLRRKNRLYVSVAATSDRCLIFTHTYYLDFCIHRYRGAEDTPQLSVSYVVVYVVFYNVFCGSDKMFRDIIFDITQGILCFIVNFLTKPGNQAFYLLKTAASPIWVLSTTWETHFDIYITSSLM